MTIAQLLTIVVALAIIIIGAWAEWEALKRMVGRKKDGAKKGARAK